MCGVFASALVASGERDRALVLVGEVLATAERLGMAAVAERARALAVDAEGRT